MSCTLSVAALPGGCRYRACCLLLLLAGCAAPHLPGPRPLPRLLEPRPSGLPDASSPALAVRHESGQSFMVGLPPRHGWKRGDRIVLERSLSVAGSRATRAVGMAVVVKDYQDAVEVYVLCQTEPRIEGSGGRVLGPDEHPRAGRCAGRIVAEQGRRVRLNLGQQDGIGSGDLFTVLDADRYRPQGRLRVTDVGALESWAQVVDGTGHAGLDVTYQKPDLPGAAKLTIVVVNFDPETADKKEEAEAGKYGAKALANALADAAAGSKGLSVQYLANERVDLDGGETDGHKQAREIGVRYGAHLVVWGTLRCSDKAGCVRPRFTVVDPQQMQRAERRGQDVVLGKDDFGFRLDAGKVSTEPLELAAAVLGNLAFAGQRFGDAMYYLSRALAGGAYEWPEDGEVRMDIAYALYVIGQPAQARRYAADLVEVAERRHDGTWALRGRGELARLDQLEGKIASAREHLQRIARDALPTGDRGQASFALYQMAGLEAQQGRVEEARKLYAQSLQLSEQIGNVKGKSATLHELAWLEAQQGRMEEARKLYAQALQLSEQIGNVKGKSATLNDMGLLEAQQGRVEEARKLYAQSLQLEEQTGDVKGKAHTLYQMAGLEAQQGRVEEARKLYAQSLQLEEQIGDVKGKSATLNDMGLLEAQQGRVEEARKLYAQSLQLEEQIGDVQGKAHTLHQMAMLEAQQGRVEEARKLYAQSLQLKEQIGDVQGKMRTQVNLAVLEADQGHLVPAKQQFEQALKTARQIQDTEAQANILSLLGQAHLLLQEFPAARQHLQEALRLFRQLGMPDDIRNVEGFLRQAEAH